MLNCYTLFTLLYFLPLLLQDIISYLRKIKAPRDPEQPFVCGLSCVANILCDQSLF